MAGLVISGTTAQTPGGGGGATASGTPAMGQVVAANPSYAAGQLQILNLTTGGLLKVSPVGEYSISPGTDATTNSIQANATNGIGNQGVLGVFNYAFNGTSWDRARGNTVASFMASPPLVGTDRSATLSVASSQLMAANTTRVRLIIKNDTAIVVWINLGATAVATAGAGNYQIAANGGYFELAGYSGVVNAIAASATPAISAREF